MSECKRPDNCAMCTGPTCTSDQLIPVDPLAALTARVERLEKRLSGIIETHHLWDGS